MIVDYTIDEEGSKIHIFRKGKHIVKKFVPYFFEPSSRGKDVTIDGKKVTKIEVQYPKNVPLIRSNRSYESDVLFPHRFILDKVKTINTDYSYLVADIENSTKHMPKERELAANGHSKILSIAGKFVTPWDSKKNYNFVLYLNPNNEEKKIRYDKAKVFCFDREENLLEYFNRLVVENDPDILTGWNSDNYDYPYIVNRMNKLGIEPNFSRSDKLVKVYPVYGDVLDSNSDVVDRKMKGFKVVCWGRALIDAMIMYRAKRPKQQRSWRLEYISRLEKLSTPKFELPGTDSKKYEEAWEKNPELFIDYNFHDVLSAGELFKQDIEHFKFVQSFAFCPIDKTIGQNSVTGSVLLRLAGQKTPRRVLPRGGSKKAKKIPGGKVFDTLVGYWEDVDILDYSSYYPNIIKTFNLSMETYTRKGGCRMFNGHNFVQDRRGLLAEAMDTILPSRFEHKRIMNTFPYGSKDYNYHYNVQKALKHLADGMYGATKNGYFRMHSIPVAETITMTGRQGTTFVAEFAKKKFNARIIGGDTDSIMENSDTDADKIINGFDFGDYLPRLCWGDMPKEHSIILHWDGQYDKFFQTDQKKHYFGLTPDDHLVQKGFYKSDLPNFAEKFQKKIFRNILDNKGVFPDKEYFEEKKNFFSSDLKDIAFVGKFPGREEFKKAVKYSEDNLGLSFLPFDRPMMLRMKSNGNYPYSEWIAITDVGDIPSSFVVDREKMWKRMVSQSLGRTIVSMIETTEKVW